MISATSFLNHPGTRPPRYRTPSPPRRAVEPISPCTTADFRASWADRGVPRAATVDRSRFSPNDGRPKIAEGCAPRRSGHGRSNSTIDTLATIALATSPTFAPLSYRPSSQNSASAMSLFPSEPADSAERPAKRPRSEKDLSPFHQPAPVAVPDADSSIFDSMKTDAELLLNFARPSNFPPISHPPKRVSIDQSHPYQHGHDMNGPARTGLGAAPEGPQGYSGPGGGGSVPPSRMRSQSDGSTAVSRPVIHGMRPSTSASTLPPIPWQEEEGGAGDRWDNTAIDDAPVAHPVPTGMTGLDATPMHPPTKKGGETESQASGQASCAACNLDRIPVDTEELLDGVTWISCDGCKRWFHIVCAGFKNDREIRTVDKFICRGCRPVHGQTTFVRKSSRARTSIDYAGLNQGLVKAASDSLEHHYIEPIREGKIQFLPESFPRMRPELVTAEYFERGNGMSEPIVIPACWNTCDSIPAADPDFDALAGDASTQEMFDELLEHLPADEEDRDLEPVVDCGQDQLDMVLPRGLTVRAVAELYGPEERVEVIDVKSQQGEDRRWTMQKWADYYESTGVKVVRNVISLEISQSKLGRLIRRPKVVRDLDLQDAVWPAELQAVGEYPKVQFYCLMSVADCYTDFHIDFGGSSVYYHILKGKKTFFFIPPKDKHLKKYEEWCNSPAQDSTFLGDQTKECYRVDLSEGDTMLIPSGWIHAVWTPENSLVIGGNFLTRLNYGMQIKIAKIEKDTKVPRKFRYPYFQKIQWYTALRYLEDDPIPQSVFDAFAHDENYRFYREYPVYYEFGERATDHPLGSPAHNSRFYSQAELEGLPDLAKYLLRTALIANGYAIEGVTADARNAIRRSIPKGVGDPVETVRAFGIWVAWKRGNEKAANWTRSGVIESNAKLTLVEKKPAGRPSRRSERNQDSQRMYTERQAVQRFPEPPEARESPNGHASSGGPPLPSSSSSVPTPSQSSANPPAEESSLPAPPLKPRSTPRGSGLGPKRVACDACRKRRIRCHHKDGNSDAMSSKQMAVGTFAPGSQTSLAHDAATALNSLAAIASEAGLPDGGSGRALDPLEAAAKYGSTVMVTPHTASRFTDIGPDGTSTGKKGRSKACDDCRKSKRRCIHDEFGRIDPVKAQERAKPRAAASAKRPRPSEEGPLSTINKKPKQESTSPVMQSAHLHRGGPIPDALGIQSSRHFQGTVPSDNSHADIPYSNPVAGLEPTDEMDIDKDVVLGQTSYASPPAFQTDPVVTKDVNSTSVSSKPTNSLVSPPTSQADETDIPHERGDDEGEHGTIIHTPTSSSRHSSRQPRHIDRYLPETHSSTKANKPAAHPVPQRRASFSASGTPKRTTTPGPSGSKKSSSRPSSSHAKKSFFPSADKRADRSTTSAASPGPSAKNPRHDAGAVDGEPDPESLRLIRELQEQEFGLRKRSTRV